MPVTKTVRLSDEQAAQLALMARIEGTSGNAVIVGLIEAHYRARQADPDFRARLERIHREEVAVVGEHPPQ